MENFENISLSLKELQKEYLVLSLDNANKDNEIKELKKLKSKLRTKLALKGFGAKNNFFSSVNTPRGTTRFPREPLT